MMYDVLDDYTSGRRAIQFFFGFNLAYLLAYLLAYPDRGVNQKKN